MEKTARIETEYRYNIDGFLREHNFYRFTDVTLKDGEIFVEIEIDWGDWKHEHLRANYLMALIGYECYDEEITEEDGSDCYSSIHRYRKA